jgi:hypothetical protein
MTLAEIKPKPVKKPLNRKKMLKETLEYDELMEEWEEDGNVSQETCSD